MDEYGTYAEKYYQDRNDPEDFNQNRLIEIPCMLEMVGDVGGKKVLDVGCGFGDQVNHYSKAGAIVTGVDVSEELIKIAKSRNIPNAEFILKDLNNERLEFEPHSFDLVTSSLVISHIEDLESLFKQIHTILKDNGVFIFSTTSPLTEAFGKTTIGNMKVSGLVKLKEDGKETVLGNYFNSEPKKVNVNDGTVFTIYHRTYEMLIKAILNSGFKIVDYKDCKPILEAEQISVKKYNRLTKLPSFCMFKVVKE